MFADERAEITEGANEFRLEVGADGYFKPGAPAFASADEKFVAAPVRASRAKTVSPPPFTISMCVCQTAEAVSEGAPAESVIGLPMINAGSPTNAAGNPMSGP